MTWQVLDGLPVVANVSVGVAPNTWIKGRSSEYDSPEPSQGRAPSACKWQRGDIAACVHQGRYRLGVVLAPPPSIQWMKKLPRVGFTMADDVYLLGFVGDDFDHFHPKEFAMFQPLAKVPKKLRSSLRVRLRAYPPVE